MVTRPEILEYAKENPDFIMREILEHFKKLAFPRDSLVHGTFSSQLNALISQRRLIRDKSRTYWTYRLSDKSKRILERYGSFFNTPFAQETRDRGIRENRRPWLPDEDVYYVNPCGEGPEFI
jgi:hypothetical protein